MTKWQNDKLTKWQNDKLTKMKKWKNEKMTKWQIKITKRIIENLKCMEHKNSILENWNFLIKN